VREVCVCEGVRMQRGGGVCRCVHAKTCVYKGVGSVHKGVYVKDVCVYVCEKEGVCVCVQCQ